MQYSLTNVTFELRRILDEPCEEPVRCSARDKLVPLDRAGGEVLPEVAPVASPLLTVGHQAEVGALV